MGRARWWQRTRRGEDRDPVDDDARAVEAGIETATAERDAGDLAGAAVRLEQLADRYPAEPKLRRELARAAWELATWQGSFRGRPSEPPRFTSASALPARWPGSPVIADPIGAGRRAMEAALRLVPRSVAWLAPLAEFREADGDLEGAVAAFENVVAASASSHSAWVVRSRHLWQFQLERAYHRLGRARVDDPLFDASLEPVLSGPVPEPADAVVAGVVRARFTHQGLNVGGLVVDPAVDHVEIALDGEVVREVNVGSGEAPRPFDAVLRRPVLDVAPTEIRVTVRTPDGRRLRVGEDADAIRVHLPRSSGELAELLAAGARIDKKGGLTPTVDRASARQDEHLRLYQEVRRFFADALDRELFVLYGTLLGVHRDGELIAGDDDLDCGYVSQAHGPEAVKAEAVAFIEALVHAGFTVSFNRRGRLFRVHHDRIGDATLHLDVHPIWFEGPDLYVHNHHRFPARVEDLLPAREHPLRDDAVLVPRRPEVLLERFYGSGWRTPDPGYVDDATGAPEDVMAHLSRALLTPDEHRELEERLRATAAEGGGRLVSIAAQSLYPLDRFVE